MCMINKKIFLGLSPPMDMILVKFIKMNKFSHLTFNGHWWDMLTSLSAITI